MSTPSARPGKPGFVLAVLQNIFQGGGRHGRFKWDQLNFRDASLLEGIQAQIVL